MSTQEPTPEHDLAPGAATRDYARDSLVPFQPLVTHAPSDEITPVEVTEAPRLPVWIVVGVGLLCALLVLGIGSVLLI